MSSTRFISWVFLALSLTPEVASGETLPTVALVQKPPHEDIATGTFVAQSGADNRWDRHNPFHFDVTLAADLNAEDDALPIEHLSVAVKLRDAGDPRLVRGRFVLFQSDPPRGFGFRRERIVTATGSVDGYAATILDTATSAMERRYDLTLRLRSLATRGTDRAYVVYEDFTADPSTKARFQPLLRFKPACEAFVRPFLLPFVTETYGAVQAVSPTAAAETRIVFPKKKALVHGIEDSDRYVAGALPIKLGAADHVLLYQLSTQDFRGTSDRFPDNPRYSFGHHTPQRLTLSLSERAPLSSREAEIRVYKRLELVKSTAVSLNDEVEVDLSDVEAPGVHHFPGYASDYLVTITVVTGGHEYAIFALKQGLQNLATPVPNGVSFPY